MSLEQYLKVADKNVEKDLYRSGKILPPKCVMLLSINYAPSGRHATIIVTRCQAKMGRIYYTPGHYVGNGAVIKLHRDAPIRAPRASIPYLWIFEGASKEEVVFRTGRYCHQQKLVPVV